MPGRKKKGRNARFRSIECTAGQAYSSNAAPPPAAPTPAGSAYATADNALEAELRKFKPSTLPPPIDGFRFDVCAFRERCRYRARAHPLETPVDAAVGDDAEAARQAWAETVVAAELKAIAHQLNKEAFKEYVELMANRRRVSVFRSSPTSSDRNRPCYLGNIVTGLGYWGDHAWMTQSMVTTLTLRAIEWSSAAISEYAAVPALERCCSVFWSEEPDDGTLDAMPPGVVAYATEHPDEASTMANAVIWERLPYCVKEEWSEATRKAGSVVTVSVTCSCVAHKVRLEAEIAHLATETREAKAKDTVGIVLPPGLCHLQRSAAYCGCAVCSWQAKAFPNESGPSPSFPAVATPHIVGKGGKNIRDLQRRLKCGLSVLPAEPDVYGTHILRATRPLTEAEAEIVWLYVVDKISTALPHHESDDWL